MFWTESLVDIIDARACGMKRYDGCRVVCDGAASARSFSSRASARNGPANGDECDPLHCVHRLPMAAVAQGLSILLDGAGLVLCVVARRNLCSAELQSRYGVARGGWPGGEPNGRRD